ncbi:Hypothetical protein FKW44_005407 [Caligus rogercresseyi]|uniref:Uncharacterized protein n=1 Tax=Caligus rogercresseyi TaxID=217165 RepID=A0A7T8KBW7_CALRO|nr:Hypothetical protein FKW44_005407 [Caligus rogercresseyi]
MLSPRPPKKKKKKPAEENKAPNPSQDNPISQLYEYCKRVKSRAHLYDNSRESTGAPSHRSEIHPEESGVYAPGRRSWKDI